MPKPIEFDSVDVQRLAFYNANVMHALLAGNNVVAYDNAQKIDKLFCQLLKKQSEAEHNQKDE